MKPKSFNSHLINDDINYSTSMTAASMSPAEVDPQVVARNGATAIVSNGTEQVKIIQLRTSIDKFNQSASTKKSLQRQWVKWFRPKKLIKGNFVITDNDGSSNERYVQAMPFSIQYDEDADGRVIVTSMIVSDDSEYQAVSETSVVWAISSSPATLNVNIPGDVEVSPRFVFRPTVNKSQANANGATAVVKWNVSRSAKTYPVLITIDATGSEFTGAAGEDIRVIVNGVESDFWIVRPKLVNCGLWVNLDFSPKQSFTLDGAISTGDTDVVVNEDIADMPASGLLVAGSEVIAYASKNNQLKRFSGCTRGAKNSTAASHSDNDPVDYLHNNIQITYGKTSPTAYVADDTKKPAFNLSSSDNDTWVYDSSFNRTGDNAAAGWFFNGLSRTKRYTDNQGTDAATDYDEIGIETFTTAERGKDAAGFWSLYCPIGISAVNFTNGEKWAQNIGRWYGSILTSENGLTYTEQYEIPDPTVVSTWQSWSQNITGLDDATLYVAMSLTGVIRKNVTNRLECDDVTVSLVSANAPTVSVLTPVTDNYDLNPTITNETTSTAIQFKHQMTIGDELSADSAAREITDLTDNSNQYQALTKLGGVRANWLDLEPGDNSLKYEALNNDPGEITLTIFYRLKYPI